LKEDFTPLLASSSSVSPLSGAYLMGVFCASSYSPATSTQKPSHPAHDFQHQCHNELICWDFSKISTKVCYQRLCPSSKPQEELRLEAVQKPVLNTFTRSHSNSRTLINQGGIRRLNGFVIPCFSMRSFVNEHLCVLLNSIERLKQFRAWNCSIRRVNGMLTNNKSFCIGNL
jgi:hypothetical protein